MGRRDEMVRLVTRLLVAQAGAGAAVGLLFNRRHASSVLITLAFVAAISAIALLARSGTHAAWLMTITFEAAFVVYGLSRFAFARYLGGTLFAVITLGTLLHPTVARAFAGVPARAGEAAAAEDVLGDPADEPLSGRALG
jgi:hypothetical protein